jgi:C4-dicarboxylate-specific signal transduction histidine kinase
MTDEAQSRAERIVDFLWARPALRLNAQATGWWPIALRYALPVVAVALATCVTYLLDLTAPESPNLFLFFIAILVSAWFAGAGPGWTSVVLSTMAVDYFFLPPIYSLDFGKKDIPWVLAFVACSVLANALSLQRRRAEAMLTQSRDELEAHVRKRTADLQKTNERLAAEIIERERAEAALRDMEGELARAARITTVAELTASIAHEINQPLAAVVANGSAALNWLKRNPADLAAVADSITAAVQAGERAGNVIGRIRSLMTKGAPVLARVCVNETINSVVALAQAEIKNRGVVLQCRLGRGLPPVLGDRVQLQQLVLNLVNNAIDAMAEISDRPRSLVVSTERSADTIVISVEDSGRGLATADLEKLFHPFYSTKPNGMGMGLSICRSIAEAHGGRISATSRSPHGAAFRVALPAAATP